MKKLRLLALLIAGLATAAQAAITAGLEIGYLTDSKDPIYSARAGWEFKSGGSLAHQVELEFSRAEDKEGDPFVDYRLKLTPIMVNYRAETTAANKLGYYFGAGVGQSKVSFSVRSSGLPFISDSANALAYQAFAGIRYQVSPNVTLQAGVKYLKIDDVTFLGTEVEVGDDLAITGGLSFRF